MFELLNFQFILNNNLDIISFNIELGGTISEREVAAMATGDHSLLNDDLIYPIYTLSSLVVIDHQTGEWQILDRVIAPLANSTIVNLLSSIF